MNLKTGFLSILMLIGFGCSAQQVPPEEQTAQKTTSEKQVAQKTEKNFSEVQERTTDTSYLTSIPDGKNKTLLKDLSDPQNANEAVESLAKLGDSVIPELEKVILASKDTVVSGWAIKSLSLIETPASAKALNKIASDSKQKPIVQTWAAAGLVSQAKNLNQVLNSAKLLTAHPALIRPIKMKLQLYKGELKDVGEAIAITNKNSSLQSVLSPLIIEKGADPLIKVMLTHETLEVRRSAAGYLAGMARTDVKVIDALMKAYTFDPKATKVMWDGGPLYVPGAQWGRNSARTLFRNLIAWHLFCDRKGFTQEKNQIFNNLRSVGISRKAGVQNPWNMPTDTNGLLLLLGQTLGANELRSVLVGQNVQNVAPYSGILERVEAGK